MSLQELPKMSIVKFENRLLKKFPVGQWAVRKISEEDKKLTLFYNNGEHVGTWMKTKCFIAQ